MNILEILLAIGTLILTGFAIGVAYYGMKILKEDYEKERGRK